MVMHINFVKTCSEEFWVIHVINLCSIVLVLSCVFNVCSFIFGTLMFKLGFFDINMCQFHILKLKLKRLNISPSQIALILGSHMYLS